MAYKIDTSKLRVMDAICMASSSFIGRMIRLWSAGYKGKNGAIEAIRMQVANHAGLVVEHSGKLWIAEMLGTGLEINSLNDYIGSKNDVVVAVKRLPAFCNNENRFEANQMIIDLADKTVKYDARGIMEFLGCASDNPNYMYCSEMCEIFANKFGATWDKWQLKRKNNSRIAPIEIQYGCGINI